MNRTELGKFVLVGIAVLGLTAATGASEKPAPLVIQEQGSFACGGTVVTAPGTFDPLAHGAFNPADQSVAGQTLHGDHAYVFYQIVGFHHHGTTPIHEHSPGGPPPRDVM